MAYATRKLCAVVLVWSTGPCRWRYSCCYGVPRPRAPQPKKKKQALVLARRYARFWVRTPGMLTTELIQYALYGVFIGSVFIR